MVSFPAQDLNFSEALSIRLKSMRFLVKLQHARSRAYRSSSPLALAAESKPSRESTGDLKPAAAEPRLRAKGTWT